ncbi:hypothetical protein [Streptomyces mutomycini]|uniref:Competence protein CoiA-like family protein n=1 Tax=Streptomyces mutomycini TaxID=284036 RepID=A0ABW0B887_9ACTN|nr:hypothetical protein [Streptomyces mutomycini]
MSQQLDDQDTRKVQTAVSGSPGADRPVYLPMEAEEYEKFIRLHPARDFYCGLLLGGCGRKLSARKYRDKKCHFAHIASGLCRRTVNDEASADHLYMGRALADWLKANGHPDARPVYWHKDRPLRDSVDVSFDRGRRLVRVQLARRTRREWEADDARLRAGHAAVEWLFGPDSMLANWQMDRQGHALRIRCRSVGAVREVEVGTQFPDVPVEWTSLPGCSLTPEGMVTPGLARPVKAKAAVPDAGTRPGPPSGIDFPLAPKSVAFTGAVPHEQVEPRRRLYSATVQPYGSSPMSALISLPAETAAPEPDRVHLLTGALLSFSHLPGTDDVTWLIKADGVHELGREGARPWSRLLPPSPASAVPARHPRPEEAPPVASGAPATAGDDRTTSITHVLEETARHAGVIDLATLAERASTAIDPSDTKRWQQLLVEVERPRGPGTPFLVSLVAGPRGGPVPCYADVLDAVGHAVELDLTRHCERERRRVWDAYRPMPPAQVETPSPPPPPSPPLRRPSATEQERAAAYDALMDLAQEAQRAEDVDAVDQVAVQLGGMTLGPAASQSVDDLIDWTVDRRADELCATAERLTALVDHLDRQGDDLPEDHVRRLIGRAEALAEEAGEELTVHERRHLAHWREHLDALAGRPTLRAIRSYAALLRPALRRLAREGRTTTWVELGQKFEAPLAELLPDDKVAILVEVDRETPADEQPLSAVITARRGPHPLYRQLLFNLDRGDLPAAAARAHRPAADGSAGGRQPSPVR